MGAKVELWRNAERLVRRGRVETELGALPLIKAKGKLRPAYGRDARFLDAAMHSGPDARPSGLQGASWGVRMGAPGALRVLVLVPCMLDADLDSLEQQARSQCTHPPGWDIAYRRCDPRDRIGAYNARHIT